ncbi:MAG: acyl carrier protein [Bryobacteraceae bacterium]
MTDPELDTLSAEVIRVIAETQRIPAESIKVDSTFEELKIDSLDGINVVFALENAFRIEIPDEAMNSMRSVRDVVAGVSRLLSESPVQPGEP